ncbi:hypothetical protein C0Q70_05459 [Pomacea canaliculata]|nr:hypothetical protein C0Q70_05459 [Pomacea canaliculata]
MARTPVSAETSFIQTRPKARRPTSLTESYSLDVIHVRSPRSPQPVASKLSASEERQTLLPKPDGQSPKSPRGELGGVETRTSSPGKSSLGSRSLGSLSARTLSPSRSIATPELEYDDFVMDDPLSYFDYEETSKLTWHGTEKLGRTAPKDN